MNESKEIIKEKLEQLPSQLREFVLNESWRQNAQKIGKQYNFNEERYASFENEVFFVLLCLEPPKDFVENLKREIGLDENTARRIADSVNGSVLSPVMKDIKGVWQNIPNEIPEGIPKEEIKSYDSFEQTILRQAQAMRPAMPVSSSQQLVASSKVENDSQKPVASNQEKKYVAQNDPYREPIE